MPCSSQGYDCCCPLPMLLRRRPCVGGRVPRHATVLVVAAFHQQRRCTTTSTAAPAAPSVSPAPPASGEATASTAPLHFDLQRLPPHLQEEFDVAANQRALRHLRKSFSVLPSTSRTSITVTPSMVHKVVWRCPHCSTQWSARPSDRADHQTADAYRCPTCYSDTPPPSTVSLLPSSSPASAPPSSRAPTKNVSLLCEVYPVIAAQWDADRNDRFENRVVQDMTEVHTASSANVWWKCPLCCTPWRETVSSRVARHEVSLQQLKAEQTQTTTVAAQSSASPLIPLCPACERRGAALCHHGARGITATPAARTPRRWLADDPLLLAEALLTPSQNPREISLTSETMLRWRCQSCQFEHSATVANRFLRHERCPQCSGKAKTLLNLLVIQRPDVVAEVSRHISRTRLRSITVRDDVELPFVCRTCFAPYRMSARARCAVPRGVPACSKCFFTHTQVLAEAQQQQQRRQVGGRTGLSSQARRQVRQKALQLSRGNRHADRLAATANELQHRDGAMKD